MRPLQNQARDVGSYIVRTVIALILAIAAVTLGAAGLSPASAAKALTVGRVGGIGSSPNTSASPTPTPSWLSGVTCTSASDCWAVGSQSTILTRTLAQHWDGTTWTVVPSGNPDGENELFGVTCVTASDCWSVGRAYYQGPMKTMIQHWGGAAWTVVPSPNSAAGNALGSVACSSATQCWAVGWYTSGMYSKTLIQRWDGSSWTVVSSPNFPNSHDNLLGKVTCTSANNCWAVGQYNSGGPNKAMIEHWNGTTWAIVSMPNGAADDYTALSSVACASSSDCYAVGTILKAPANEDDEPPYQTLIEHWNGSTWSIVASADSAPTEDNQLFGISCASSTDCWAVGLSAGASPNGGASADRTLFEHWDGSAWTIVPAAVPEAPEDFHLLGALSCVSPGDCWAIGRDGSEQAAAEHWDGAEWMIYPSLKITQLLMANEGGSRTFSIDGKALGASQIHVEATSDLKNSFVPIAVVTLDSNRRFHFDDSGLSATQPRFYRTSMP